jgi:hypothetical protein
MRRKKRKWEEERVEEGGRQEGMAGKRTGSVRLLMDSAGMGLAASSLSPKPGRPAHCLHQAA